MERIQDFSDHELVEIYTDSVTSSRISVFLKEQRDLSGDPDDPLQVLRDDAFALHCQRRMSEVGLGSDLFTELLTAEYLSARGILGAAIADGLATREQCLLVADHYPHDEWVAKQALSYLIAEDISSQSSQRGLLPLEAVIDSLLQLCNYGTTWALKGVLSCMDTMALRKWIRELDNRRLLSRRDRHGIKETIRALISKRQ
jgi:hypothetical protein